MKDGDNIHRRPGRQEDPVNHERKLTYRTGWKSGTIEKRESDRRKQHFIEADRSNAQPALEVTSEQHVGADALVMPIIKILLREAPIPSAKGLSYFLAAGSAISFFSLCYLVYSLLVF